MLKTSLLTAAAILAFGAAPAFAQYQQQQPRSATQPSRSASQAGSPASAIVAPAVAVVVDPSTGTAVAVPVNPNSDVPPEVTAALKALAATGKVKPGQVVEIVVQRGNQVTQVIANAPVPDTTR